MQIEPGKEALDRWSGVIPLIEQITAEEGVLITFTRSNPEWSSMPPEIVTISRRNSATGWSYKTYRADTLAECLRMAIEGDGSTEDGFEGSRDRAIDSIVRSLALHDHVASIVQPQSVWTVQKLPSKMWDHQHAAEFQVLQPDGDWFECVAVDEADALSTAQSSRGTISAQERPNPPLEEHFERAMREMENALEEEKTEAWKVQRESWLRSVSGPTFPTGCDIERVHSPADGLKLFIDAIIEQSPNGETVSVKYHPSGEWTVYDRGYADTPASHDCVTQADRELYEQMFCAARDELIEQKTLQKIAFNRIAHAQKDDAGLIKHMREHIFASLRNHDVNDQCFAEIAAITYGTLLAAGHKP